MKGRSLFLRSSVARGLERQSRIRNQFDRRLRIIRGTVPPDILIDVVGIVCERTRRDECLAPTVEGVRVELRG